MTDAANRLAGIKSINENEDLGNGLTTTSFKKQIDDTQATLEAYNSTLALADQQLNAFHVQEKALKDMHERALIAVAAKYGKDSDEYEMAGGKRKSERAKPKPKQPAPAT